MERNLRTVSLTSKLCGHLDFVVSASFHSSITSLAFILFTSGYVLGQREQSRARPRSAAAVDYSKFSHATAKHRQICNSCHKIPTSNWRTVREFPDVADYPDHDACVSCHRNQFFKGARPAICTVCHSKVSPRDNGRFTFRKLDSASQFSIEFPHDKHQDVISRWTRPNRHSWFIQTSLATVADDKVYNNCAICHATRSKAFVTPSTGWVDSFVPEPASFKSAPTTHASCFSCHWKAQQPVATNCAGCHQLAAKPFMAADSPKRISIRFRHSREQHIAECTTCHINITRAANLRGLKPDVPITACTECHNKDGLRLDVSSELEALDKKSDFVCTYCHTSDVGRFNPPANHYLIAGREPLRPKGSR